MTSKKKFDTYSSMYIFIFLLNLTITHCFPCPYECICIPTDILDEDFPRINYIIDCKNVKLNNNKLIYNSQFWSINDDKIDDNTINDYVLSIDLSDSSSLEMFSNKTIELTSDSFIVHSLSLTNQSKNFLLDLNSFHSSIYQHLKVLNLSSCCQKLSTDCSRMFVPLKRLEILDLSRSDMYKVCLNMPDTISSTLRDLILRYNSYDTNTFSHTSQLFDGVRQITGILDLQYSNFNMSTQIDGNCLFDVFNNITTLDLSYVMFLSTTNSIEIHLKHLLKCKTTTTNNSHGQQLMNLYLRQLNIEFLPDWLTNIRFPRLTKLDLSYNNIKRIDIQQYSILNSISLAFNPIELNDINWRLKPIYQSINLCSIKMNQTRNLTFDLQSLFSLTTNIDYSDNKQIVSNHVQNFPIEIDFSNEISLNLSKTNIYSFNMNDQMILNDLYRLDISSNCLTQLNLENQWKLSYLDCSNQYINNLILSRDNTKLIELKCSNNSLKTIENFSLLNNQYLIKIDLSYNSFESIDSFFLNVTHRYLREINFKSNLIEKISTNLFNDNYLSLYSIDLSFNKINFIEKYAFQLPNLQILDLRDNPLKFVETNFMLKSSIRLLFIFNNQQQLVEYCSQPTSSDNLLLDYMKWYEKYGIYMKQMQSIDIDKCLRPYISRSKTKWMKINEKYRSKHVSLFIISSVIIIGSIFSLIYMYRKNKFNISINLRDYRRLDRQNLMEYQDDTNCRQQNDDEIVLNLDEQPFNRS